VACCALACSSQAQAAARPRCLPGQALVECMSPRRHRGRISFALVAVLLILSLFVLHGAAAGAAAFAAMLGFILACIDALHR
jgi:hypothetical protein